MRELGRGGFCAAQSVSYMKRLCECDSGFVAAFADNHSAAAMGSARADFARDFLAVNREYPRAATAFELAVDHSSAMSMRSVSFLRDCIERFHFRSP
jgi:hypothetical protein